MATVRKEALPLPVEPEEIVIHLTKTEARELKRILAWQKVVPFEPFCKSIYIGLGDLGIDYTF